MIEGVPSHEARFLAGLVKRGADVSAIRCLIRVSDSERTFLLKNFDKLKAWEILRFREATLSIFESLLQNPPEVQTKQVKTRPPYKRVPEEVKNQILQAMLAEPDFKVSVLAARFGVSDSVIRRLRDGPRIEKRSKNKLSDEDRAIARQLRREGFSPPTIARRFGCSAMTIRRI
jgi:transposase-like protein